MYTVSIKRFRVAVRSSWIMALLGNGTFTL
jgi:hypothetical protein